MGTVVSFGHRIRQHAAERPDDVALVFIAADGARSEHTFAELDQRSERLAHLLVDRGVGPGQWVGVMLQNSSAHVVAALAVWKAGAAVITLRWDVPAWERDRLIAAVRPVMIIGVEDEDVGDIPVVSVSHADTPGAVEPLDERIPERMIAIPSGGSTGASKAIVMPIPGCLPEGAGFAAFYAMYGIPTVECQLVPGPLYHGSPFVMLHAGLFDGQQIILTERFKPAQIVEAISEHRPQYTLFVPTMMKRLLDVPGIGEVDWSCFHMILHGTAPCPAWLKRRWIDLVGPARLWETFASSELVGQTNVRGDEWLERPGTVGKPSATTEIRVLDKAGREVRPGDVGEIYLRVRGTTAPAFRYLGTDVPKVTDDGFVSVGDLGSLDADGYLFPADRLNDLIISGGANIVPAEVEAAMSEHPDVVDVAVIGLPDDDLGQRAHAVVVVADPMNAPTIDELLAHARSLLAPYKVPRGIEIVDTLPRSDMFKIRRSALVAARTRTS
jgi:bile acid-coenzyme A ligase